MNIKLTIIDFNRTIYDPASGVLIDGASELLAELARRMPVVLVSKNEAGREELLPKLGIARYFIETVFTDEKTPQLFGEIAERYGALPGEMLVIGDYVPAEIVSGNTIGAYTVHVNTGVFADRFPDGPYTVPWKRVTRLRDVMALLD